MLRPVTSRPESQFAHSESNEKPVGNVVRNLNCPRRSERGPGRLNVGQGDAHVITRQELHSRCRRDDRNDFRT